MILDTPSVMDLFEELTERQQYIVGWKTGMYGPVKTSKLLAKELSIDVSEIDESYINSINFLKKNLLDE